MCNHKKTDLDHWIGSEDHIEPYAIAHNDLNFYGHNVITDDDLQRYCSLSDHGGP